MIENAYDIDKLSDTEVIKFGLALERNRKQTKKELVTHCTDCHKVVEEPITSWKISGIELLSKGDKLHKQCVINRIEALQALFAEEEQLQSEAELLNDDEQNGSHIF